MGSTQWATVTNKADFDQTLQAIQAAAFDDSLFGPAFAAMDEFCGLHGGQITALQTDAGGQITGTFGACYIHGDPRQEIVADWMENYERHSENIPRIGRLPVGKLTHNKDLFTAKEKRTSLMYNEFQAKYDCRDQLAVVLRKSPVRAGDFCIWTMRNDRRDWSGADRLDRIRSLLPHIGHAVRVRQALAAAAAAPASPERAYFDETSIGVAYLDRHGAIALANAAARRLLAGPHLRDAGGIPSARGRRDNARLRKLVAAALPRPGALPVAGTMHIKLPLGASLTVDIHPIVPDHADFGAERMAARMLIQSPDADAPRFDASRIAQALGLTPRQGQVAALLGEGKKASAIAVELGITVKSAYDHLENIRNRTGLKTPEVARRVHQIHSAIR